MSYRKNILFFAIISFLFFSSRWMPSYYLFDETASVKIILESVIDGYYYFPLVKYLSIFDFNNSFSPNHIGLDNLMLPFYSVFIHSIFYKFLGSFSFILIEFLSIFIFLIIIFNLFKKFYSQEVSILFSITIFSIPIIISILPISEITSIQIIKNNIFSLRFPRPLITTLYLFFFIYLISSFEKKEFLNKKNFFILGIIYALTLSSFYYFFFLQVVVTLLYLLYRYKSIVLKKLLIHWDSILVLIFTFIIFSIPLIINILFHESDYSRRLGIININFEQKIILIKYFLTRYLKTEFLFILITSSIYIFYINNQKIKNYRLINLFYLSFIGSVITPIFFILITTKTGILFHFNNITIIFTFLLILVILFDYFDKILLKLLNNKIINILSVLLILITISINFYKLSNNTKDKTKERLEFNKISNLILENYNLSESTLMTFDNRFMVWSVLNNIKFLNLTNFIMSPKRDEMIEDDLIRALKFFDLNSNDFNSFIANKKTSWRYINYDLNTFFFYKYIANPVKTYKGSKDFNPEVYDYIMNSSPINFEQSIIPNFELERLNKKFTLLSLENFNYPDIIIINKKFKFIKEEIEISNYCKIFDEDFFILMFQKSAKTNC